MYAYSVSMMSGKGQHQFHTKGIGWVGILELFGEHVSLVYVIVLPFRIVRALADGVSFRLSSFYSNHASSADSSLLSRRVWLFDVTCVPCGFCYK